MAVSAASVDLFEAVAIRDAEDACAAAEAERVTAARRYAFAPHGTRADRLRALQAASEKALAAEVALSRLRRAAH